MKNSFCGRLSLSRCLSPFFLPARFGQERLILAQRCIWNRGCLQTTNWRHPRWILAEPTGHVERTHRGQKQQTYGLEDDMRQSAIDTYL